MPAPPPPARLRVSPRAWPLVAVAGGLLCLGGDHLHVVEGVLFYPHAVFWDQAWWVFPLFFGATLLVVGGVRWIHPVPAPRVAHPVRIAVADVLTFLTAYAFTAFAHGLPNVVLFVLIALWVARVIQGMPSRHVLFCLLVAVGGTSWEAFWSGLGMFTYREPDLLGVPRWLPALYLHAAVAADAARGALEQGEPRS